MRKTITLLLVLLVQLTAQAQLRSGHFFKTLQHENLTEQEAKDAVKRAEDETGLPANDPVRFGADNLVP